MQELKIYILISFSSFILLKHKLTLRISCKVFIPQTETLWKRNLQYGLKYKFPSGRNSYLLLYLLRVSKNKRLAINFRLFYCNVSEYMPHPSFIRL